MNLLVKFNLIFIVVLGAGLAVASISARSYLQETARNESIQDARLMIETTLATRDYTQKQIRPLLQKLQRLDHARGLRHLAAKAHMIQLALHRTQTRFDVPQAFTVSQLRESHREILIPTREITVMTITVVARHAFLEFLVWKMGDQL